jgi:L-fuculose-phosphate aldolase
MKVNEQTKDAIIRIARIMWDRRLSDVAGGNISIRGSDGNICITPKLMGFRFQWQIDRSHISVLDPDGNILEGSEGVSREVHMHVGCYKAFPEANAIIHAHPYWTNVFVSKPKAIVPGLETTRKFGTIEMIEAAHGYSQELADKVIAHFAEKKDQWAKSPLEVILPFHGIVAMGRDMNACLDIVDRIETECRCQILGKLLD